MAASERIGIARNYTGQVGWAMGLRNGRRAAALQPPRQRGFAHDMTKTLLVAGAALVALASTPAHAQEDATVVGPADEVESPPPSVYDGDWISVGAGVGYAPSYDGSDDYVFFPAPLIQGQVGPVGINPRPAGLALDFVKDPEEGVGFDFGVTE